MSSTTSPALTIRQLELENIDISIDRWNLEFLIKDRKYKLITSVLLFIDSASITIYNFIFLYCLVYILISYNKKYSEWISDKEYVVVIFVMVYLILSTIALIYLEFYYKILVIRTSNITNGYLDNYLLLCTITKSFQIWFLMVFL